MKRTQDYYQILKQAPYHWAHYAQVLFQSFSRPLSDSRVALIITAAPYDPAKGAQGPGAAYNPPAKFYRGYSGTNAADHELRISYNACHRKGSPATDPVAWVPLPSAPL
jgi:hypothetical protein